VGTATRQLTGQAVGAQQQQGGFPGVYRAYIYIDTQYVVTTWHVHLSRSAARAFGLRFATSMQHKHRSECILRKQLRVSVEIMAQQSLWRGSHYGAAVIMARQSL
jgi:hypothetical protein